MLVQVLSSVYASNSEITHKLSDIQRINDYGKRNVNEIIAYKSLYNYDTSTNLSMYIS